MWFKSHGEHVVVLAMDMSEMFPHTLERSVPFTANNYFVDGFVFFRCLNPYRDGICGACHISITHSYS